MRATKVDPARIADSMPLISDARGSCATLSFKTTQMEASAKAALEMLETPKGWEFKEGSEPR